MAEGEPRASDVAQKQARLTRTSYFRTTYSNTFRVRLGSDDIGITFGYQSELPGQSIIQDECEIVLVPKILKFLSIALSQSVESLEAVIGKIELAPETIEILKSIAEQQIKDAAAAKEEKSKSF